MEWRREKTVWHGDKEQRSGRAGGVGFVEGPKTAGHVTGEIEDHDSILIGHFLEEMVQRGGPDFDGDDWGQRLHGGGSWNGIDHAHFAEESSTMKMGEEDRPALGAPFDDIDIALHENEEGVAGIAFPNDGLPGRKIAGNAFGVEQRDGRRGQTGEQRRGGEGGVGQGAHGKASLKPVGTIAS